MSTVDERIVNMKIDNQQFLSGAKASQDALNNLNKTIDGSGKSSRGFMGLGSAIDGVKVKLGALNTAAMTAVATITNKLVNAGISMVKSITIDPILAGFREYETNLNSVQTIMANTGKNVKTVNKYLNELNEYSDKTIYNFSEMARNIGTFTAAGVDLKTATASIKGIANLAALSGSNSQQAATAMYQLSQGIAAGKIGLQDWNSVVNAGMGGKVFQKALATTATVMGTLNSNAVKTVGPMEKLTVNGNSFRESIMAKPGDTPWLSSEVLTTTLKTFTGDMTRAQLAAEGFNKAQIKGILETAKRAQDAATKVKTFTQLVDVVRESVGSGFARIFQNLFGTFTEAKKLWTGVADVVTGKISAFFDAIDKALFKWRQLDGYKNLWEAIGNIFQALGNIMSPFLDAIGMVLPKSKNAGKGLAALTEGFLHFTEWLERATRGASALGPIFETVGMIFGGVLAVIVGVVKYFAALIPLTSGLTSGIGDLIEDVGRLITEFLEWADIAGKIEKLFNTVIEGREAAFKPLLDTIGAIIAAFGLLLEGDISGFKTAFKDALTLLDPLIEKLKSVATTAQQVFAGAAIKGEGIFASITGTLANAAGKVREFADSVLEAFDSFKSTGAGAALAATAGLSSGASAAADGGLKVADVFKTIAGWLIDGIKFIGQGFETYGGKVIEWFSQLDKFDLMSIFSYILTGALFWEIRKLIGQFAGFREIGNSITGSFDQLTDTFKTMQTAVKANIIKTIAISVGILAASLWLLSKIPMENMKVGLGGLAAVFTQLGVFMTLMGKGKMGTFGDKGLASLAAGMILISLALVNIAGAVAIFGNMSMETLAKGFGAITATLSLLVAASIGLSAASKGIFQAAAALVVISFALQLLAAAIFVYSKMDWDTVGSGLLKMGAALTVLAVGMNLMNGKRMISGAAALTVIAVAMNILAVALKQFSDIENTTKALLTLGISLGLLVLAVNLMQGAVGGALALAVVASSIIVLANALEIMGSMDIPSLAKALGALAVALAIFLAAGALAQVVAGGLLALGAAIIMIGAGLALAGVGMALFAAGLATLVALGAAAFGVITAAIQVFLALLPTIAVQVAAAMVAWIEAMAAAAPRIRDAVVRIVNSMMDALDQTMPRMMRTFDLFLSRLLKSVRDNAPKMGRTFLVLLNTALRVLETSIPRFARSGYRIILGLLDAMNKYVPRITRTAVDLIVSFLNEIGNGLPRIIRAGTNVVIKFIEGIGGNSVRLANAAAQTLIDFLNGLASVIRTRSGQIEAAGWNIASAVVQGMVNGLGGLAGRVWDAAMSLADGLPLVVRKALGIASPSKVFHSLGGYVAQGLANGISSATGTAVGASARMAQGTIDSVKKTLDSHSPSQVMKEIGLDVGKGFIQGMVGSLAMVAAAGALMAASAVDTISKTVSALQFRASAQSARARAFSEAAALAAERSRNKKLSKAQKKAAQAEARRLGKKSREYQKQADATQRQADAEAERIDEERRLAEADDQGKSDIYAERANKAAEAARQDRENAMALAREADLIRKKDAKRAKALDKRANEALASAQRASERAKSAAQQAAQWSASAVLRSAEEVARQIKEEKDEVALQARLATMSSAEKAEYYKKESQRAKAESDAKYAEAEALLAKARAEAGTNANQARLDVEAARAAVEAAEAAKDKSEEMLREMENLLGSPTSPGTSIGGGSSIDPSLFQMPDTAIASSLVYGAQNMFDAYTKALAATVNAASKDSAPTVQFVQNNTSPVALTPSEVYRQSKNLLSDAERKLTSALTP